MISNTTHRLVFSSASDLSCLDDGSIHLVVTSPPYPMIQMWDELFFGLNPAIGPAITDGRESEAFELMHQELDRVWNELPRVVSDGGIVCINIGDATRTLQGNFQLFSSHSRIISKLTSLGFQNLPNIIWRKTTNAPNKFMGSGMLPPGAYVTLEHEYVLVFRKGQKREFKTTESKRLRRESAFFWEERNKWFSDVWFDLTGVGQELNSAELRKRSAAYPFELAYRLVNMFSVKGDCVLDPFLGTGTTSLAALATERNSVAYEIDGGFRATIDRLLLNAAAVVNPLIARRIQSHHEFVEDRLKSGKELKFQIDSLGIACISGQETDIRFSYVDEISPTGPDSYGATYQTVDSSEQAASSHILTIKKRKTSKSKSQTALELN